MRAPENAAYTPGARPRSLWVLLSLFWITIIFWGSSTAAEQFCERVVGRCIAWSPGQDLASAPIVISEDQFWLKKTAHVILFLILAFLLSRAFQGLRRGPWVYVLAAGVMVGIVSECIQIFYPTREATIRDGLINAAT